MKMRVSAFIAVGLVLLVASAALFMLADGSGDSPAAAEDSPQAAAEVRDLARRAGAAPISAPPDGDPALVDLGESLFFDPILSGNRDISCGDCHHPEAGSGDGLPLSVGTGGTGVAEQRLLGEEQTLVPRNAPPLYNRGHPDWRTMFWDGRVEKSNGGFRSPAGLTLPEGLDSVLAVQALFPPTSRDEMRGHPGDRAIDGTPNELAEIVGDDLPGIWTALTARVVDEPGYRAPLKSAFPDRALSDLGFADLANAIAAYEAEAFASTESPWDAFLAGDDDALDGEAVAGAQIFFGDGGCAGCHSGVLMTDQAYHATGVPQIGPGRGPWAPADIGRAAVAGSGANDSFAFRTPSLRNVALTGPWMHNGAYDTLAGAVRHMVEADTARQEYRPPSQPGVSAHERVSGTDRERLDEVADTFGATQSGLSEKEVVAVVAFLEALTDPAAAAGEPSVPESVPSGLAPPKPR